MDLLFTGIISMKLFLHKYLQINFSLRVVFVTKRFRHAKSDSISFKHKLILCVEHIQTEARFMLSVSVKMSAG